MAAQIWRRVKLVLLEIWTVILSIIFMLALPLLVILFSPIYLYRYCLSLYINHFRPDFGKILSCGNATMASYDDIYGNTQNTTVVSMKVEGMVDIEKARSLVLERLIYAKREDGSLRYPELQQYPEKFGGFYVWKPADDPFNICDHVNYYTYPEQGKIYTDEEAADIESYLGTKKHTMGRGPWEFIILPNVKSNSDESEHSIVFFRTHHCVTDGFGIYALLFRALHDGSAETFISPVYFKRNIFRRIIYYLSLVIRIPYDILHVPTISTGKTDSGFRNGKSLSKENHASSIPLIIPAGIVKRIRKNHNVSFNAVITAAFVGGLRRMMMESGMKIPASMGFCCPGPMPGHPITKLRVRASAINMMLPIGISDSVKRLKAIGKVLQGVKKSTIPLGTALIAPIIGSLPAWLIDKCFPGSMISGSVNNFPGPQIKMAIFNKPVVSIHFTQGQSKLLVGILCTILTYLDDVAMKITVNKAIFNDSSDIDMLNAFVLEELSFLSKEQV